MANIEKKDEILEFYKDYPIDHWLYKANMLKNVIENFDSIKNVILKDLGDVIEEDCIKMLKAEIHFTLFQMIETLFELIFTLEKRDDRKLWLYLSLSYRTSKAKYKRIEKISKGEIEFLDNQIRLPSGKEITLIHYLFYFWLEELPIKEIKENFEKIKQILIIFAETFTDRIEYNAYKHSLKFFQTSMELEFGELKDNEKFPILNLSSDNTFAFLYNDKGQIKKIFKSFDYEIDFEKIIICHWLISNIINARKRYFFNRGGKVKLAYFNKENFDRLNKTNYTLHKFEYTIGRLKKNTEKSSNRQNKKALKGNDK